VGRNRIRLRIRLRLRLRRRNDRLLEPNRTSIPSTRDASPVSSTKLCVSGVSQ